MDLAVLASIVSVGTSLGSVAIATAAFRRSSPRVRVTPGDFTYRASSIGKGRLIVDVRLTNFGDKPARIAGASLVALAPLPRGTAPEQLTESLLGGTLVMPGRRAMAVPLGPLRPISLVARRSARWQEFRDPLNVPDDETAATVRPFDGIEFSSPVYWSVAKKAHWLRFEISLATGVVLCSPWWRNPQDVIESYEAQARARAADKRGATGSAQGLRRVLRIGARRDRTGDGDAEQS